MCGGLFYFLEVQPFISYYSDMSYTSLGTLEALSLSSIWSIRLCNCSIFTSLLAWGGGNAIAASCINMAGAGSELELPMIGAANLALPNCCSGLTMALELLFMTGNLSATGGAFELLGELRTLLSALSWFSTGSSTFTWFSGAGAAAAAAAASEETDEAGKGDGSALECLTGDLRLPSASCFPSEAFSTVCGECLWYVFNSFCKCSY